MPDEYSRGESEVTILMSTDYISRQEKSTWGIYCNQNVYGELFVGKGWGTTFSSQFSADITTRVKHCLTKHRGDRNGHFWVNLAKGTVTMMIGDGRENETLEAKF